jgi:hypothetical protein
VRVAVALVAGQAALCAVIGWVTFGPSEAKPDAAGVHPLTKPIVFPTAPPLPLRAAPVPPDVSTSKKQESRAARPSRTPTTRATANPAADRPQPVIAPAATSREPVPTTPPGLAATQPPAPSPSEVVQSPVVVGRPCRPEGAKGRTSDAVDLRCVKDADGDLVWQIN